MGNLQKFLCVGLGMPAILLGFCLLSLPDGKIHVFVLDIGQGDSILVQTPTNERILIDGGPDDAVLKELGKVMPFYEKTIDVVVLTHPHADHVNGLVEVLKRYKVGAVIMSGVSYNYSGYTAFLEEISSRRIPVLYAGAKIDGVPVDYRLGSVTLDMLFPFQSVQGRTFLNVHESMVVFRLLYGHESFLLTGDLEAPNEEKLIANGLDLHADFLKVGHHGSSTSSGGPFLDRVRPSFAAISCGIDNKFHHPYPATIDHLQQRSIKIFRTDLDGIIEAVSDGESLRMKAQGK